MLPPIPPIPTLLLKKEISVGVYEGGGYSAKGIYRPAYDCRMKTNEYPEFCPVCQRAIRRMIEILCSLMEYNYIIVKLKTQTS